MTTDRPPPAAPARLAIIRRAVRILRTFGTHIASGGRHLCSVSSRWVARLGKELEDSPFNQLTFFLAFAGLVFGVVSSWDLVVGVFSRSWKVFLVAVTAAALALAIIRRYGRKKAKDQNEEILSRAHASLSRLLQQSSAVTHRHAVEFLEENHGAAAKSLVDALLADRRIHKDYDDYLRIGATDE